MTWVGALVRLRAPEPGDVDALMAVDDDGEGWRLFPPRPRWAMEEWARGSGNDGDEFRVVIEALSSADVVGTLNTQECDPASGTFGYGITVWPWHRRCGYGRDAVTIVLRHLFGERRYQKCTVGVLATNEASIGLHRSLGFTEEGRVRRAHFRAGAHVDELLFGITVEEFAARWGIGPSS